MSCEVPLPLNHLLIEPMKPQLVQLQVSWLVAHTTNVFRVTYERCRRPLCDTTSKGPNSFPIPRFRPGFEMCNGDTP